VLYVADSYNHKIKDRRPKTAGGEDVPGRRQEGAGGRRQAALPRAQRRLGLGDKLFIADTNNHAIRVCDLKTGRSRR
jgi:hypothetical protein